MNRLDRALGILLYLRSSKGVSAGALARRFEVAPRTIYRDVELLSTLGVPIYAERGRRGGFRLLEGYFLPPIMFTQDEALGLMVSLSLLHSLRSKPFAPDLETAERKLVAAVSEPLRAMLLEARQRIGFEMPPQDVFHPEPLLPQAASSAHAPKPLSPAAENRVVQVFLQAIFSQRAVSVQYRSPYRAQTEQLIVEPHGVFWDRGYWYLVGTLAGQSAHTRQWRADRVIEMRFHPTEVGASTDLSISAFLGGNWLKEAMQAWREEMPVRIRLTEEQAKRLQQDWYYRHARYEPLADNKVLMIYGDNEPEIVMELLRWLGPGAELLEPRQWRGRIKEQLTHLLRLYSSDEAE
jgi:predicted DNA-binding transcriptional regulator YafY